MKKPLIIALCILLAAGTAVGGVFGITALRNSNTVVTVFPVSNVVTTYYGDGFNSGGMVSTDVSQDVYLRSTDVVKSVFVREGQSVAVGDPLVEYDTAMTFLQLQIKDLELQALQSKYNDALAELERISGLKAGQRKTAALSSSMVYTDATLISTLDNTNMDAYYTGDGSADAPFTYLVKLGTKITSQYILAMSQKAQTDAANYYARFEIRAGNTEAGRLHYLWTMVFAADGSFSYSLIAMPTPVPTATPVPDDTPVPTDIPVPTDTPMPTETPVPTDTQAPTEEPTEEPIFTPAPYYPPVERYTQEEIDKLLREQKVTVQQAQLDIKNAQLAQKELQQQLENAVVKAKVAGTVKGLLPVEEAMLTGQPLLSVTGGTGYLITGTVGEAFLSYVTEGATFNVYNWQSNATASAVVTEVSVYPSYTEEGTSLPNSTYTFTAYVEDSSVELTNGNWVELTMENGGGEADSAWYLDKMFIRQDENGASYVLKRGEDGLLVKQPILTGKLVYGSYLEIRSGLTQGDYITFPYGTHVKPGVKTEINDSGDMSWMYK